MIPTRLRSNLKLKAMALVLASLSWYIVNTITNYPKTLSNLDLAVDLPDGWSVLSKSVNEFDITFRGTREDLALLNEANVSLSANLTDEDFDPDQYETVQSLSLSARNVSHDSNTRVIDISPREVVVRIGLEGQKLLPVRVNLTGEPARGLHVETINTEPARVMLYGARERLEAFSALQTAPINLSDRIGSFEQRVDVLPPTADWIGRVEPSRVLVRITLAGVTDDRLFSNIPVRLFREPDEEPTPDLRPIPPTVDVTVQGRPERLEEISPNDIRAFASAIPDHEDEPQEVLIHLPHGLELLDLHPPRVRLRPPPNQSPPTNQLDSPPEPMPPPAS